MAVDAVVGEVMRLQGGRASGASLQDDARVHTSDRPNMQEADGDVVPHRISPSLQRTKTKQKDNRN